MKKIFITIALVTTTFTFAQYTNIINSKRPGLSESPYGVGSNVFQFESGLFFGKAGNQNTSLKQKITGGELFFRYGNFSEKLEFNANIAYQSNKFTNTKPIENYTHNGINRLTIGAKYLIYQQEYTDKSKEIRSWKRKMAFDYKRLIPSVGIYAGVNTNFLGKAFKEEKISYKGAIFLQNDFSNRFILVTNLIADNIGLKNKSYQYIATATFSVTNQWSIFGESQGTYTKVEKPEYQAGGGIAYLFNKNLQLDASIRKVLFNHHKFNQFSIGGSWRLDKHKDKATKPQKEKREKNNKRKGFFSRLFRKK